MTSQGKSNGERLQLSSEIRSGPARRDDPLSTGSLLLNFMNQASGNVKNALEKPANFKRNINHRRYLQKQLRNYSKRKGDNTQSKKSSPMKHKTAQQNGGGRQNYKSQNIGYVKSLQSWSNEMAAHKSNGEKERNALKERNLPASFWQEPVMASFPQDFNNGYSYHQYEARTGEECSQNPNEIQAFLDGWNGYEARGEFSPESTVDSIPSISSEDASLEEFMTCEELTRNLDIKDLYVPEMYSADRLLNDVQETLYAGQISPSQYYLPSPAPYSDQGYFNFSLDLDSQGLPPIAMAFLNQNSLSSC
ncbi:protein FAM181A-like [Actinia tenebrosa]|uniref:Protein FAM181A-like n=1 Tax=Actinia tenebrosa TaxID=6105 RepID=A0A6P8IXD1_ACTTE|nr:protein FAM181A-like [Actinia tenebrosa]